MEEFGSESSKTPRPKEKTISTRKKRIKARTDSGSLEVFAVFFRFTCRRRREIPFAKEAESRALLSFEVLFLAAEDRHEY